VTPTPHDAYFKSTFSAPERAAELLRSVLDPRLAERIDWTTLVHESGSFVDEDLREQHADLLFRATLDGREIRIYLLLEHQSAPDRWMVLWLLRYMVRSWVAHVDADRQARKLPPILPAVIHHGDRGWTADTSFAALVDIPADLPALAAYTPNFRFALADLATVDADDLRRGAGSAEMRMALLALKEARIADDLRRLLLGWAGLLNELERDPDGPDALHRLFSYLLTVRDAQEFTKLDFRSLGLGKTGEDIMETREAFLIRKGREEEREESLQRMQRLFLSQLRLKFSHVPHVVVTRVEAADVDSLTRWSLRILTAGTLDAVFAD
jgi:predicted transposase/invertase (TIGR01784 family)